MPMHGIHFNDIINMLLSFLAGNMYCVKLLIVISLKISLCFQACSMVLLIMISMTVNP